MTKKSKSKYVALAWLILPICIFFMFAKYLFDKPESMDIAAKEKETKTTQNLEYEKLNSTYGGLVTFWFDDAWLSQYEEGFKILKENDLKGALAVPTHLVEYEAYMNWFQIRKIAFEGWEVDPHSRSHDCNLVNGTEDQIKDEILGSKKDLSEYGGIDSNIYIAPCGVNSDNSDQVVKQNFIARRLVEPGINTLPLPDRYDIRVMQVGVDTSIEEVEGWINQAKTANGWLIMMFHQIDHEGEEYSTTPEIFEEIVNIVKDSNVQVVLPAQVLNP